MLTMQRTQTFTDYFVNNMICDNLRSIYVIVYSLFIAGLSTIRLPYQIGQRLLYDVPSASWMEIYQTEGNKS